MERQEGSVLRDITVMGLEMNFLVLWERIILMKVCLLVCLVLLVMFVMILLLLLQQNVLKDLTVLLEFLDQSTYSHVLLELMENSSDLPLAHNAPNVLLENTAWLEAHLSVETVMQDTYVQLVQPFRTQVEELPSLILTLLW